MGKELEKDASSNQQRFWAKVNGSRRTKKGVMHVYDNHDKVLSEGEEVVKRWKEHFEGLYQEMDGPGLKIGDEVIEQVDTMKYLGVMVSNDGSMEKEIEARIGNAARVIGGMNDAILRRKELSRSTKIKVVNATMMPVLMYGCETWRMTKKQQSKVQATQINVLRRIEGVNRLDRVRNADIKERLNQEGEKETGELEGQTRRNEP